MGFQQIYKEFVNKNACVLVLKLRKYASRVDLFFVPV